MIVADTNLIAYLLLDGEYTSQAEAVFQQDADWFAPYLWRSEFRNILALYLRKKLMSFDEATEIIVRAETLLADREREVQSATVLNLVLTSSLSAYDCEYVALARQLNTVLITSDRQIIRAFGEIAISPTDFIA